MHGIIEKASKGMIIDVKLKNGDVHEYRESTIQFDIGFITIVTRYNELFSFPLDSVDKIEQMEDRRP